MEFDFKKAKKRIFREELKGNNPVPDILSFIHLDALYEKKLDDVLSHLFEEYKSESKSPSPLLKIYVPKPNFTIRPMSRPETKDWLLYEAIVQLISTNITKDSSICKKSFSYLNLLPETERENNWVKFDNKSREFYVHGNRYAVVADLTGYYENISLNELRKRIINYMGENDENRALVDVLHRMLRKWSEDRVSGYGLPQGPPASSFLADIYLDHVDHKMDNYENYVRYMDDIRIFCKTEIEAKLALKELIIALGALKLNINAKKTEILREHEIESKLFDPAKSLFDIIESILKSKDASKIKEVIPPLTEMFETSFLDGNFEKSHLNFSLYRLSTLHASGFEMDVDRITSLIRDNFIHKPHHTGLFCYFLTPFPKDKLIIRYLIDFIKDTNNIYEWQEAKVVQSLLKFYANLSSDDVQYCIRCVMDSNKHFAVRAFYSLLIGKHGSNRDREILVDLYDHSWSDYLKAAFILAVQQLGYASRNEFYSRIKENEGTNDIGKFVDYVKSLKNPLYFLEKERPKLETLDIAEPSPY